MSDASFTTPPDETDLIALAEKALAQLPAPLAHTLANVLIRVEEFPDPETEQEMGLETPFDLLGLYRGIALPHRSVNDIRQEPDVITLYRQPILACWCEEDQDLPTLVRHVLIHEIGHHFGFSDADMEALEAEAEAEAEAAAGLPWSGPGVEDSDASAAPPPTVILRANPLHPDDSPASLSDAGLSRTGALPETPPEALLRLFEGLPRQGPGSAAMTQMAYRKLADRLPAAPRILDIGCGSGGATLPLAQVSRGTLTAIDIHPPFLEATRAAATLAGVADRVFPRNISLFDLEPLPRGAFDLVWAEGSIYLIGFAEGLRRWRPWLVPGGCIAVTHLCWLTETPAAEAVAFWEAEAPGITTIAETIRAAEAAGYQVLETLPLPDDAWWETYYTPLEARIAALRYLADSDFGQKQPLPPDQDALLAATEAEIALFRRYSHDYGYVFFLMQSV